jgi:putative NIF3 family GTP cyclohydrolase 1 type 2
LAIDLTDAVAREALGAGVEAIVVYHPPIFKGIRSVTPDAPGPTSLLPDLLAARTGVIALHTALDHAKGGTNDLLLDAFDIVERRPLEPIIDASGAYKLVVFVPPAEVDRLRDALSSVGAGVIGHYSHCSYQLVGQGTFLGDEQTRPAVGRKLALERVEETRLEMVVPKARLAQAVRVVYATHSYEEPAFDLYPIASLPGRGEIGSGRVGRLRKPQTGAALLERLRSRVDLSRAQTVGNLKRRFSSVTAAAGSYGVATFRDPDSLVLTGEFKHHDALDLLRRHVAAVRLDHYASEQPVLTWLRGRLAPSLRGVRISISRKDRSPFTPLTPPEGR